VELSEGSRMCDSVSACFTYLHKVSKEVSISGMLGCSKSSRQCDLSYLLIYGRAHRHTRPELVMRGMRGLKPAGFGACARAK
jgi:hypothetical protein